MTALGLGDIAAFPFVDAAGPAQHQRRRAPARGARRARVREGQRAASPAHPDRPQLAQLPVDPRLARMVLEADARLRARGHGHRRRAVDPGPARTARRAARRPPTRSTRGSPTTVDFLGVPQPLGLPREQQKELSGNQFRRLCSSEYLNYLRVREWQDIFGQLRQVGQDRRHAEPGEPGDPQQRPRLAAVRAAVATSGMKDPARPAREYLGARNARFAIFPGSGAVQEAAAAG